MKALWAAAAALAAVAVSWFVGGPVGGVLNAPGLLMLGGARALGILPRFEEPSLGRWIAVGTILSALFWGLATWLALRLAERKSR
jgi:hypothetical protein